MANYAITAKLVTGNNNTIADNVKVYLETVDSSKVIRGLVLERYGMDNFAVLIVHDT